MNLTTLARLAGGAVAALLLMTAAGTAAQAQTGKVWEAVAPALTEPEKKRVQTLGNQLPCRGAGNAAGQTCL